MNPKHLKILQQGVDAWDEWREISVRIPRMDWAGKTEDRGNASETAGFFFHPSGPPGFGYLIQLKSLIYQSKLAHEAGRVPFHPVNPGSECRNITGKNSIRGFRKRR